MYRFLASPSPMTAVIGEDRIQLTGETPVDLDAEANVDGVVIDDVESTFGSGRLCVVYDIASKGIKILLDYEHSKYMTSESRDLLKSAAQARAVLLDAICGSGRPTYRELLAALT